MEMFKNQNVINVSVKNIEEFKRLIEKANNEARQLQNTINELNGFDIKFSFSVDNATTSIQSHQQF